MTILVSIDFAIVYHLCNNFSLRLVGQRWLRTLHPAVRRNQHVTVSWHNKEEDCENQAHLCEYKAGNHHRIVSPGVKFWIGEAEDDCQNGRAEVSQQDCPVRWYVPILAASDDDVEIPS